jgi:hypothetical protein
MTGLTTMTATSSLMCTPSDERHAFPLAARGPTKYSCGFAEGSTPSFGLDRPVGRNHDPQPQVRDSGATGCNGFLS